MSKIYNWETTGDFANENTVADTRFRSAKLAGAAVVAETGILELTNAVHNMHLNLPAILLSGVATALFTYNVSEHWTETQAPATQEPQAQSV